MAKKSVLIIKHGFSETCDHHVSPVVSFGDIFRSTCMLENFKDCHVTWVTAAAGADLLAENHLIDRLILADAPDEIPPSQTSGHYDTIINLEKQQDWCLFALGLSSEHRYGFKKWANNSPEGFYPESASALTSALQRNTYYPFQDTLFRTIGREWTGQRYVLGYQPKVPIIYDIGLNNHVGAKWPTKVWPKSYWDKLYYELTNRNYAVCWQQSLNSIRHYIDWLASCRLIITCDSLGLHLSLGLKKKIVALFGPTPPEQVYMYGCGVKLTPTCEQQCVPCFASRCNLSQSCMESITVETAIDAIEMLLSPQQTDYTTVADEPLVGSTV